MRGRYQIALIVGLGAAIRIIAVFAFAHTPFKPVDVYYVDSQAASIILKLSNPYAFAYAIHEAGRDVLAYLPAVPLYYAPFAFLGDIRYGNIVADGVIMVSLYWIGTTISVRAGSLAAGAYALLPISIDLTSVAATNMMIGTMFLMLSLASLLKRRFALSALIFGLALAANQFMLLAAPVLIYFFWKNRRAGSLLISALVALALILPFFLMDPRVFFFDVALFQFVRPLQPDGWLSLYSLVFSFSGVKLDLWVRLLLLLASEAWAVYYSRKSEYHFLFAIAFALAVGSFVLPVNGFWNYFLPPCAVACSFTPAIYTRLLKSEQPVGESIQTGLQ